MPLHYPMSKKAGNLHFTMTNQSLQKYCYPEEQQLSWTNLSMDYYIHSQHHLTYI